MSAYSGTESADFYVFLWKGQWTIGFDGKLFGPCDTKKVALRLAKRSARKANARELASRVLKQQDGETFKVVYASGQSAAPQ
ncbi:MAG: hypothetical protein H0T75_07400 [Rhizobiales bacterium]|nr:hypothetical protein [Hyphomicrobiales bacterium]